MLCYMRLLNVFEAKRLAEFVRAPVVLEDMMCYGLPGRRCRTTIAHFGFSALGRFRLVHPGAREDWCRLVVRRRRPGSTSHITHHRVQPADSRCTHEFRESKTKNEIEQALPKVLSPFLEFP